MAAVLSSAAALALLVAGCGSSGSSGDAASDPPPPPPTSYGPPVGHPVLPDLVPQPPKALHTKQVDGRWQVEFSSIIVNTGEGEFVLHANRDNGQWHLFQDVPYSTSGAKVVPIPSKLIWGGDGHNHWHVERVAINWMVPVGPDGKPEPGATPLVDSKVGFCMYDFDRVLDRGPTKAEHVRGTCGDQQATDSYQGLSVGWEDVYDWTLPGQNIDVQDLPDGQYRLYAQVDKDRRFREANRANDLTWVDFTLGTMSGGVRTALVTKTGPTAY